MNELKIFEHEKFGTVRTITEAGKTLFCGKDVAMALGYKDSKKAISRHCRGGTKRPLTDKLGRMQEATFISEGDIYRLAAKSELPGAAEFESWIFDEVLPSIRRNGGYINGQENMTDEELMAKALMIAHNKIEERNRRITLLENQIELDRPKVEFAEAVNDAKKAITVEEYAKALYADKNIRFGRNKMFSWLRENKYLRSNNYPYQKFLDQGWFITIEKIRKDGMLYFQTLITGKGQRELYDRMKIEFNK